MVRAMPFESLNKLMTAKRPVDHMGETDVRRLVILSALGTGCIGSVILFSAVVFVGFFDESVIAIAVGCAGILALPLMMRAGLGVRATAWAFVLIALFVCFYVSLDSREGVRSGLLMFLSVLMVFTGGALGARALLGVGLATLLGIAWLTFMDIRRLPLVIEHSEAWSVVLAALKQVGAVLISIAMVLGALAVFRRAMEEVREARDVARRASATKSAFLANTSHEIRTPLNGVLGMAELLQTTDLTPTQRRYLDTITESGRTLLAMLNDVLDLSKVEAGQMTITSAPTDIRALLSATMEAWRPSAEGKGLTMSLRIAADLPQMLQIDRIRVRQCVENLISNAIKFTDEGGLDIHVRGAGAGPAHMLRIDVADTGWGVPAEALPSIFEPFQQAKARADQPRSGTGLGLAIVRNLARLMGGDLVGESEVGRGSTFTLTVRAPVVRQSTDASRITPVEPSLTPSTPPSGGQATRRPPGSDAPSPTGPRAGPPC